MILSFQPSVATPMYFFLFAMKYQTVVVVYIVSLCCGAVIVVSIKIASLHFPFFCSYYSLAYVWVFLATFLISKQSGRIRLHDCEPPFFIKCSTSSMSL